MNIGLFTLLLSTAPPLFHKPASQGAICLVHPLPTKQIGGWFGIDTRENRIGQIVIVRKPTDEAPLGFIFVTETGKRFFQPTLQFGKDSEGVSGLLHVRALTNSMSIRLLSLTNDGIATAIDRIAAAYGVATADLPHDYRPEVLKNTPLVVQPCFQSAWSD